MRNARITALNSCSRGKFEGKLIRCPDHILLIHCALYWSFLAHCAWPLFTNNAVLCAPFFFLQNINKDSSYNVPNNSTSNRTQYGVSSCSLTMHPELCDYKASHTDPESVFEHLTLLSLTNECFKVRVKRGGVLQARV